MLIFVWSALLYVHPSFAIILMRKRELVEERHVLKSQATSNGGISLESTSLGSPV